MYDLEFIFPSLSSNSFQNPQHYLEEKTVNCFFIIHFLSFSAGNACSKQSHGVWTFNNSAKL